MTRTILFCMIIFFFNSLKSQEWQVVNSFPLDETITAVGNDINGMIYLGSNKGTLIRIDPFSSKLDHFSFPNMSAISFIDAWNSLKIFLFMMDNQEYMYLDRFIADYRKYNLPDNAIGINGFVLPAPDHSIWILEQPQLLLKKYNDFNQKLINSIPITLAMDVAEVTYVRAYQNLLLIAEQNNGLLILDAYGNLLKQIPLRQIKSILITSDRTFVLHEDGLAEIPLTDNSDPTNHLIPIGYQYGLRINSDFILIDAKKLDVLRLQ